MSVSGACSPAFVPEYQSVSCRLGERQRGCPFTRGVALSYKPPGQFAPSLAPKIRSRLAPAKRGGSREDPPPATAAARRGVTGAMTVPSTHPHAPPPLSALADRVASCMLR